MIDFWPPVALEVLEKMSNHFIMYCKAYIYHYIFKSEAPLCMSVCVASQMTEENIEK